MSKEVVIKETKYCRILAQGKVMDGEYTYAIEKVFVKNKERDEIRFCLYKDTATQIERYIPRSLDVTEQEFLELFREGIRQEVFSKELIVALRGAAVLKKQKETVKETKSTIEDEESEKDG